MSLPIHRPGLGRRFEDDPRNGQYPLRALLAAKPAPTRYFFYHRVGPILDQGQTGTCVGHGWRQWLTSARIMSKGGPDPFTIYREACKRDAWTSNDDGNLQAGTSVLAGAKYLHELGIAGSYHWAQAAEEAVNWLLLGDGVLVIGVNFYQGMEDPGKGSVMRATGQVLGGHCMVLSGVNRKTGLFRVVNSWGRGWGENGLAWLPVEDLGKLLREDGECCLAVQVTDPA